MPLPLVLLDEIATTVPLIDLVGIVDDYDPELEVLVAERKLTTLNIPAWELFAQPPQLPVHIAGESYLVLRINPGRVAIAPPDTPVHAFSHDLIDFPGS